MLKRFYFSIAFVCTACSLFAANDEIARGDDRGRGGDHREDHNYNRNDMHRNEYNRYEGYRGYAGRGGYDHRYDGNWNNGRGAYGEGVYEGVLLNNVNNPDVEYTQPGSTDNFNQVYQENLNN